MTGPQKAKKPPGARLKDTNPLANKTPAKKKANSTGASTSSTASSSGTTASGSSGVKAPGPGDPQDKYEERAKAKILAGKNNVAGTYIKGKPFSVWEGAQFTLNTLEVSPLTNVKCIDLLQADSSSQRRCLSKCSSTMCMGDQAISYGASSLCWICSQSRSKETQESPISSHNVVPASHDASVTALEDEISLLSLTKEEQRRWPHFAMLSLEHVSPVEPTEPTKPTPMIPDLLEVARIERMFGVRSVWM